MIPKETTLEERLEFYEWSLDRIEKKDDMFLCHCAERFFNIWSEDSNNFKTKQLFELFPEVCKGKVFQFEGDVLWNWNDPKRIEALQKAIIEVKRKIKKQ